MNPITTTIIPNGVDVFTVTTKPIPGDTPAVLRARHAADIVALANFIESQMGRGIDAFACDEFGVLTERDDSESLEDLGERHIQAIQWAQS